MLWAGVAFIHEYMLVLGYKDVSDWFNQGSNSKLGWTAQTCEPYFDQYFQKKTKTGTIASEFCSMGTVGVYASDTTFKMIVFSMRSYTRGESA